MIKKLLIVVIVLTLFSFVYHYQTDENLKGTKWNGIVYAPGEYDATLEFKTDSFFVYFDNGPTETMTYQTIGDTLKIKKISGGSPCGEGSTGLYKYAVKENVLTITAIKDDCIERGAAFSPTGYKKNNE